MKTLKKYYLHIALAIIIAASVVAFSVFKLAPSLWAIILPNLAFMYLFWNFGLEKPIPIKYIIWALVFGIIAIAGSAIGQVAIGAVIKPLFGPDTLGIFNTVVVAPFTEEILKGAVILWVYFKSHKKFGLMHGLVYAGLTGFAFAMGEQILFSLSGNSEGIVTFWDNQYFISTLYFGLGHGIMTGFIGLACAKAALHTSAIVKRWLPWAGLVAAIVLHGIYNYAIVYDATHGDMVTPVMAAVVYIAIVIIFAISLGWIVRRYFYRSQNNKITK